jgi:diguanylate cyclase (GGDEF)-like protein
MTSTLQLFWIGPSAPDLQADAFGPFVLQHRDSLAAAAQALREGPCDALVLADLDSEAARALGDWPALSQAVLDAAVLVAGPGLNADVALRLIDLGVQDVLPEGTVSGRTIRLAVQRKRLERAARKAYATDLSTGLPNHAQLLEHMSHLLALREREPAPMALLVLRIEGLSTAEAALGTEAANVLRRKVAVRLRAGLRASDVVAAIGADTFAVLLAWIDAAGAADQVAAKLTKSLQQTFNVAGQALAVAVSVGVSHYPEHGRQADDLLRRALGSAAAVTAAGRAGYANRVERGAAPAANDE